MGFTFKDIDSFEDFKFKLGSLIEKEKGNAFEELTLAYLKLEPKYATKLKHVWPLQKIPVDVRDHLGLPPTDEGIDFVAETTDGKYWAIQSKYKDDETATLGLGDLGTFTSLTFAICKDKFDFALVVTTASRLSSKLVRNYGNKIGQITSQDWRELDPEFFDNLKHLADYKFKPAVLRIPRKHQQKAIDAAEHYFIEEGNRRGKLSHPCASGKSLTGYWIAERFNANMVLVAVPSLALVRQAIKDYLRETFARGVKANWIAVCSDNLKELDDGDNATLPQDLGIKIHTNTHEIALWLKQSNSELTYVFSTYQSGRALAEASRIADVQFDLGIFDEAHRTVGKRDALFSHLLFDENIDINRRVFMTATERHYRGNSDQFVSMSHPDIYGETFDSLSFKEALESDPPILCDYKIVTMVVTRDEVNHLIQNNLYVRPEVGQWNDDVEAQMLASAVALRKVMQRNPIKHAVSFHGSIARAKAFQKTQDLLTQAMPSFGELETFHVTGATPTAKRSQELERFTQSGCSLITNARCLTEGVDVPGIDCVLFADPRRSTVDIVQAVGRALRRAEGKEYGYVVIPVLIDTNIEGADDQYAAFEPVLTVLRALGANDDRIIEYFRSRSEGRKTGRAMPDMIDMPDNVSVNVEEFIESIELQFWSRLAKLSWRPFEEARFYVQSLNLKSSPEWELFCHGKIEELETKPPDIPTNPNVIYRDKGWNGYGDWLGTGNIANFLREYRSFEEARIFARNLGLKSGEEWRQFCKGQMPDKGTLPSDIPQIPHSAYRESGWISNGDWLGTGIIAPQFRAYRSFEEARSFARRLDLKTNTEWVKFCRGENPGKGTLPEDVPAKPDRAFKGKGWKNWGDWLGTGNVAYYHRMYRPFKEARDYIHSLKLKSYDEWRKYCKGGFPDKGMRPTDIPSVPQNTYKENGWISLGDWLGTGNLATNLQEYRSFEEARDFIHNLKLNSQMEWRQYCKGEMLEKGTLPKDIPRKPERAYKENGWKGLGDWLGTGRMANFKRNFRPFDDARDFARGLGLKSVAEWNLFCKGELLAKGTLPDDIPTAPHRTYRDKGWQGIGDWLGKNKD